MMACDGIDIQYVIMNELGTVTGWYLCQMLFHIVSTCCDAMLLLQILTVSRRQTLVTVAGLICISSIS